MKTALRRLGTLLVVAGIGTIVWAVVVWRYEDPFTGAYTAYEQRGLEDSYRRAFDRYAAAAPGPGGSSLAARKRRLGTEARRFARGLEPGQALGRIRVPRMDLDMVFVNGTDAATLKRGPGRYLGSGLPGQGKLVYIAGHRTTFAAPFSRIEELRRGDPVVLELPYGTFRYRISQRRIVAATALEVLRSRGREEIVLQACHPRFFATQRFLAYARPVSVTLRGGSTLALTAAGAREAS